MIVYLKTFIHTGVYILREICKHTCTCLFSRVNVNISTLNGIATTIITKRTFTPSEGLQKPLKEYGRQRKMQWVIIWGDFYLKTDSAIFEKNSFYS